MKITNEVIVGLSYDTLTDLVFVNDTKHKAECQIPKSILDVWFPKDSCMEMDERGYLCSYMDSNIWKVVSPDGCLSHITHEAWLVAQSWVKNTLPALLQKHYETKRVI